jgi:hypothetical protein
VIKAWYNIMNHVKTLVFWFLVTGFVTAFDVITRHVGLSCGGFGIPEAFETHHSFLLIIFWVAVWLLD